MVNLKDVYNEYIGVATAAPAFLRLYSSYLNASNIALVQFALVSGRLRVVDSVGDMESIIGYTNDEIKGMYLDELAIGQPKKETLREVFDIVDNGGRVVKSSIMVGSDGQPVNTRGKIWKDGDFYIEEVWRVDGEFVL